MTPVQRRRDWEERYGERAVWTGRVNAHLTDWVQVHRAGRPGTAIDLACGEGADAIWLAEQGWQVTGVDFSASAIARAKVAARDRGLEIAWRVADVTEWRSAASADLVSVSFLHEGRAVRIPVWKHASQAVAPGGTLLVTGHAPDDAGTVGPPAEYRFTPDEVIAAVGEPWRCDLREVRREGVSRHVGHVVTDVVIALTRRAAPSAG